MRFRKKPLEVDAMQWTGDNIHELWDWGGAEHIYGPTETNPTWLIVTTIHDEKASVALGNWVIREPDGERFYPCEREVFAATYDPVTS